MDEIEKILEAIDYRSFYQRHIPGFDPNGTTQVKCHCPLHKDDKPSLSVNLEKGVFKCFGCGEQGGMVKFIQLRYGLDKKEALEQIKEEEGIRNETRSTKSETAKKASHLSLGQVKLIHNQLLKNEAVLKMFQDKYGLSRETIEKYLIGYQHEHFVIPVEAEPGKWTIKEHKGIQSKGAKVSLYPPGVIKEGLPYVIVTEGEFKALLLNQLGFSAVSGTGGAATWKREWNSFFSNLNVILAYDNDEPGQNGATNVVNHLKGIARSVKVIQWPSAMDSKDKKDVTDLFITLGKTKDDFQMLIDSAKEMAYDFSERNFVFAHPAYEIDCNFLSLGFRETIVEDDRPKDKNFYILSHNDTFTILDNNVFQSKDCRIIFDTRERLLIRHQDRWHKNKIKCFINNPTAPTGLYAEIKQTLITYIEFSKEEI